MPKASQTDGASATRKINVGLGGQADRSWRLQAWTGATMGLFAVKRGATVDNHADLGSFTVTSRE